MCDGSSVQNGRNQIKEATDAQEKKQRLVEKAIPNIVNSIKTVVSLSKNEDFKQKCLSMLKVTTVDELSWSLNDKLWSLAALKLQVKLPQQKRDQIVPTKIYSTTDKQKQVASIEHQGREAKESSDSYFDDLVADERSFYWDSQSIDYKSSLAEVDLQGQPNRSDSQKHKPSFECLGEMYWNICNEDTQLNFPVQLVQTATKTAHLLRQDTVSSMQYNYAAALQARGVTQKMKAVKNARKTAQLPQDAIGTQCDCAERQAQGVTQTVQAAASKTAQLPLQDTISGIQCNYAEGLQGQDVAQTNQSAEHDWESQLSSNREITDHVTSPKAKLRCCESAPTTNIERRLQMCQPSQSSTDWLQDFSEDCFWVEKEINSGKKEEFRSVVTKNTQGQQCVQQDLISNGKFSATHGHSGETNTVHNQKKIKDNETRKSCITDDVDEHGAPHKGQLLSSSNDFDALAELTLF